MLSTAPAQRFAEVTPSDTSTLTGVRGVYVGGTGTLEVVDSAGTAATFTAVPAGCMLPISPTKIMSTGTSATQLVALY